MRVPFVDIPLMQTIAPWLAAHTGITKPEIAATVSSQIPASVLHKPKTGFSVPVREWLLQGQPALQERGMRGWARFIHKHYIDQHPASLAQNRLE
jgi:asparagine synthase (glutamine-hydrolysing)